MRGNVVVSMADSMQLQLGLRVRRSTFVIAGALTAAWSQVKSGSEWIDGVLGACGGWLALLGLTAFPQFARFCACFYAFCASAVAEG